MYNAIIIYNCYRTDTILNEKERAKMIIFFGSLFNASSQFQDWSYFSIFIKIFSIYTIVKISLRGKIGDHQLISSDLWDQYNSVIDSRVKTHYFYQNTNNYIWHELKSMPRRNAVQYTPLLIIWMHAFLYFCSWILYNVFSLNCTTYLFLVVFISVNLYET